MLYDDSSVSLIMWQKSRLNEIVAVPAPPRQMTELRWARFLYETHCQVRWDFFFIVNVVLIQRA